MGILAGLHQPDAGSIYINDARVRFPVPEMLLQGHWYGLKFMLVRVSDCGGQHYPRLRAHRFGISRDEALRRIKS